MRSDNKKLGTPEDFSMKNVKKCTMKYNEVSSHTLLDSFKDFYLYSNESS